MNVKELIQKDKYSLVARAYEFARKAHLGQKRKNGEPYFTHVLAAAESVLEWGLDDETAAAALLHDVVEDTPYSIQDIREKFGEEVAFLVDGVTKIGKVRYRGIEAKVENLRKFILYLSRDMRVILVKLADRLHNMKTLYAVQPQKQKRIALETMEIYAPLAYRLGMQRLSGELEDLAFPYIYPEEHKWLIGHVKERFEERERFAQKLRPVIEKELNKNGIESVRIDSRAKRYTSLYKKLLRYDMNVESIYDLVAIRIIVPSLEDCYSALGIVHKMYPPVPHRFKDYVALPKSNGYRSLHTTVFGPENKITEIQIKTEQMHDEAEHGIAAHFAYQKTKDSKDYLKRNAAFADKKELVWVQQLKNWQKGFTNPEEFLASLKIDFFQDRILALTPKGEVFDLPAGATPVDFAYQVHTEIGNHCSGVKINGKIGTLDQLLKSGDIVEIVTQKNKNPSDSWLNFVRTGSAKNHIRTALRHGKTTLNKSEPKFTDFRLAVANRDGLFNEISNLISRSHGNILTLNAQSSSGNQKYTLLKIRCAVLAKDKSEKMLEKLKALKEIKEISYKHI